jgi:hypothetical protein
MASRFVLVPSGPGASIEHQSQPDRTILKRFDPADLHIRLQVWHPWCPQYVPTCRKPVALKVFSEIAPDCLHTEDLWAGHGESEKTWPPKVVCSKPNLKHDGNIHLLDGTAARIKYSIASLSYIWTLRPTRPASGAFPQYIRSPMPPRAIWPIGHSESHK